MQLVAQAWLVLVLTGDPFMLGVVSFAQYLPITLGGLFGGVLAEQLPKRTIVIATQAVAMMIAVLLFVLTATNVIKIEQVLIIAVVLGVVGAVDIPTRQAFAVELVGREDIASAVGLTAAAFNLARVVGPAIAGAMIAVWGVTPVFLVNALSYSAVIGSLLLMNERELYSTTSPTRLGSPAAVLASIAEGLKFVNRTPGVRLAVTVVAIVAMLAMNSTVVVPVLADEVLKSGAQGFGLLMAAYGVGSIAGALSVAISPAIKPTSIGFGAIALGLASILLGVSRSYPLSLLAMAAAGAGGIGMTATANASIQLSVPDHLRARVMSVYTAFFVGSAPVGGLLAGTAASTVGVPIFLISVGTAAICVGLIAVTLARRLAFTGR